MKSRDYIALLFIIVWLIAKFCGLNGHADASLAMILGSYFGKDIPILNGTLSPRKPRGSCRKKKGKKKK